MQLYWAVVGDCFQCKTCNRYFAEYRLLQRHMRAKIQCSKEDYEWKYAYARTEQNLFFCYYGCSTFKKQLQLELHLIEHHEDDLNIWGICPHFLRQRTFQNQTHSNPQGQIKDIKDIRSPHLDSNEESTIAKPQVQISSPKSKEILTEDVAPPNLES